MTENNSDLELFDRSLNLVPGGVHSPVRSFKGLHRRPVFFKEGKGAFLVDGQGKNYIDFCMSFGPLILGHQDPVVKEELKKALDRGWSFGACEPYSLELAEFIVGSLPFIEQIRFVNSGTEAVMTALRLARGYTGKNKILKFSGCYHGHSDALLMKAGSGVILNSEASSKGIPPGVIQDTLVANLGDRHQVEALFQQFGKDIAALIIEPLPANNGLLIQDEEFLKFLREITSRYQTLLIFDEVISGFRIGLGGMSTHLNITPDLVTYGKIIGGGLPVGAVAGKKSIMSFLSPQGEVYQAGTLSANPLAMTAGLATLKQLTTDRYEKLNQNAQNIYQLFREWLGNFGFSDLDLVSYGSLFWFIPNQQEEKTKESEGTKKIQNLQDIPAHLGQRFNELFKIFLEKGIYLAPNAYEVGFISLAHDESLLKELKHRLWK